MGGSTNTVKVPGGFNKFYNPGQPLPAFIFEFHTRSKRVLPRRRLQKGGIEYLWNPREFFPQIPIYNKQH